MEYLGGGPIGGGWVVVEVEVEVEAGWGKE
jgi:hypothetical protein